MNSKKSESGTWKRVTVREWALHFIKIIYGLRTNNISIPTSDHQ